MTALLDTPTGPRQTREQLLAAKVAPPRRTGQWAAGAVAAPLFAMLVHTVLTNPRLQWTWSASSSRARRSCAASC